jgi:hypothetical protein
MLVADTLKPPSDLNFGEFIEFCMQGSGLAMIWISEKEELNVVLEAVERHEHQR